MELTFREQTVEYLSETVFDPVSQELTAELIVPDTLPDVGRLADCSGMVLVQSRSAEAGGMTVTGGVRATVLYVPDSGEGVEALGAYLPFTVSRPAQTEPESALFYWGWLRGIDARCINSRKVLIRANLGSELTLLTPETLRLPQLTEYPAKLECRTNTYPCILPLCWSEREVSLADEVPLPEQLPSVERVLKWSVVAEVTESRILGSKAVFKGNFLLRCLYQTSEGALSVFQTALPYSQYAELDTEPEQGILSIQPILCRAELDTDGEAESRRLLVDFSATAQIIARGAVPLTLTEDAYVPDGSLDAAWQSCPLTPTLDVQSLTQSLTIPLPAEAETVLDWSVCADAPTVRTGEGGCRVPVAVNLLYYDPERMLRGTLLRGELTGTASGEGEPLLRLMPGTEPSVQGAPLVLPLTVEQRFVQTKPMRTLSGGTVTMQPWKDRPSLLVRRCGGALWDIAKQTGSTVRAIEAANGLDTDTVEPDTLLLIPLGQSLEAKEAQHEAL